MQTNNTKFVAWDVIPNFKPKHDFIDPRILVARHIGWKKTTSEYTDYSTPEPENYNRAIFTTRPMECPVIEDQVIYYDSVRLGWITLMYVPDHKLKLVDTWICNCDKLAVWHHSKPPKVKPERTLLWTRGNMNDKNLSDNERLYTMGYFAEFKVKYFSDDATYVDSLLGPARAVLDNFVPEEQDEEVEDF